MNLELFFYIFVGALGNYFFSSNEPSSETIENRLKGLLPNLNPITLKWVSFILFIILGSFFAYLIVQPASLREALLTGFSLTAVINTGIQKLSQRAVNNG